MAVGVFNGDIFDERKNLAGYVHCMAILAFGALRDVWYDSGGESVGKAIFDFLSFSRMEGFVGRVQGGPYIISV